MSFANSIYRLCQRSRSLPWTRVAQSFAKFCCSPLAAVRNPSERVIVQHFHIFKNGGSTVIWALQRAFAGRVLSYDKPSPRARIERDEVLEKLLQNPDVVAFTSHQVRLCFIEHPGLKVLPLILLRDPIDRLASMYSYFRRNNRPSLMGQLARSCTFPEFISWLLDKARGGAHDNSQVMYCSHAEGRSSDPMALLEIASQNLTNCPMVGTVDRMDETLVYAEQVLAPYFPEVDLAYVRQNVSPERPKTLNERLSNLRKLLGNAIWSELEERHALDRVLHARASAQLDERVRGIPDFHFRLARFRDRCSRLQIERPR